MMLTLIMTVALMVTVVPGSLQSGSTAVTNLTALAGCLKMTSPSAATARQILDHVTANQYVIVPSSSALSSNAGNNRLSGTTANTKGCPFTWATDFDSSRRPTVLLKAVCPASNTICAKCRAITYGHRVLKYKCNALWDWATVNLPVAFVRV